MHGRTSLLLAAAAACLALLSPATAGATTKPFAFTGGAQTFKVPAGVTSLAVDLSGAQGGGQNGGKGAHVSSTIAVTPGEVLVLYVGGRGGDPATGLGGFNGGGGAAQEPSGGGGGGGATDLRRSPYEYGDRLLVAAG